MKRTTALHRAAAIGDWVTIETLLAQDIQLIGAEDEYGRTPLQVALAYNQLAATGPLIRGRKAQLKAARAAMETDHAQDDQP